MANQIVFNVSPDFNIQMFAQQLAEKYRMEGFAVTVAEFNGSEIITFDKETGGINTVLGLGQGIKATCMVMNGALVIDFSDADWTGKIIGLIIGWFICLIPGITALIGAIRQSQLPKKITNDAMMIASQQNPQNPLTETAHLIRDMTTAISRPKIKNDIFKIQNTCCKTAGVFV